ncbi:MAG: 3-phosphoglycerate dehydrogenase [Rhodospirillaceae bacterium]|nr:3-phosphoglycerate dehydrogenase [Rhodospirillaceae bacterium]
MGEPKIKFKVLTLNSIAKEGLNRFSKTRYNYGNDLSDPSAILLRSQNIHDFEFPSSLLAVARAGAGINNIPIEKLSELGVPVFNAPGANANAVKELVIGAILMGLRNLPDAWEYVSKLKGSDELISSKVEAGKKKYVGCELPSRTLGVIGLGAIGVEVANACLSLGMRVIGYDPKVTVKRAWQLYSGVQQAANLEELFKNCDIITAHIPLNGNTKFLINYTLMRLLPSNSIILNFARNGVVDNSAVIELINEGCISTYICDFPTPEIKDHQKVICLPHLGASTVEAEKNCAVMVADNLIDFLENGNVGHSVNMPEAKLSRTRPHRLSIANANVPSMVGQISTALAEQNINIADMLNVSRGDLAYTLMDIDDPVDDETFERISSIDGILRVRILPQLDEGL